MKNCPNCHQEFTDDISFCPKCGQQLVQTGKKACPNCNQDYEGDIDFCPNGHNNNSQKPSQDYQTSMGFGDAIRVCFKEKYASAEGRAKRAEYWYFFLFKYLVFFCSFIMMAIFAAMIQFVGGDFGGSSFSFIMMMGLIIPAMVLISPSYTVLIRRLHDIGRSGWWILLYLIPYIGAFVIFIFTLLDSQRFDNKYGPYVKN